MSCRFVAPVTPTKTRLVFLDYLRVFAVSSVLITHLYLDELLTELAQWQVQAPHFAQVSTWILRTFFNGSSGVLVFFLVSGYVISYVLKGRQVPAFLINRIFRIYPLYVTLVLITYFDFNRVTPLPDLVHQLLLVGDFFSTPMAVGGVEWTLRIEMMFYLFAAALAALGLTRRYQRWLMPMCAGLVLVLSLAPAWPVHDYDAGSGLFTFGFPYLLLGMAVFAYDDKALSGAALASMTVLVLGMFYTVIRNKLPILYEGNHPWVAVVVFAIAWRLRHHLVAYRWLTLLSALTYSLYLTHAWLARQIEHKLTQWYGWQNEGVLENVVALLVLLLICYVLHKTIEQPFIHWGRRWVRKTPFTSQ
jgi:peptidoglycan/LPS O-acetylase OafA/YrhL